ncbi:MAG: flagellar hook protein FlgE [Deltaproteobacteria bacterium]|nr:flagellar hook protein FlgE [Deltaproteobacteria bacterium]
MTTGASGMRAESEALSVVSDNIANVNTIGFKRSRAVFEDVLGRSVMGSNAIPQSGGGSRVSHITQMWTQGALVTTGVPTDMALSGDGFFVVKGGVDGVDSQFYTRAGQFHVDSDGFVVNADGLRVQGYQADDTGSITATMGDLQVDGMSLPATPTDIVQMGANLSADFVAPPMTWDPANPDGDASATVTFYDSLGQSHEGTVYFINNGGGAWDYHVTVDGAEVTGGTPDTPFEGASGTLQFNPDGSLQTETTTASSWNFVGATPAQTIDFDFGTSLDEGGTGFGGMTQLAGASTVLMTRQDGFSGGPVQGIRVDADGTVTGVFGNGQDRALGRVAVAKFASNEGLARAGHNLWAGTRASGEVLLGEAGTGGRGSVVSGSLESSNVDLGSEFVDLIAFQRGFSANSKIVTTADEMYQELVNLKR